MNIYYYVWLGVLYQFSHSPGPVNKKPEDYIYPTYCIVRETYVYVKNLQALPHNDYMSR